jgi:ubiquinone/menaquinone biosynthesis C-methylase UbiE
MPFKIYEFYELLRGVKFSKEELILDIGCGNGLQTLLLGRKCKKVIGIDTSEEAIIVARHRASFLERRINSEFRCTRIEEARFQEGYFDKVFSISVIEHIPDYFGALREAYRVLKPGGQFVFSVDSLESIEDSILLDRHRTDYSVKHYFRREGLEIDLHQVGFSEIEVYSIFKSDFAKSLFIKGIGNRFHYSHTQAILGYLLLRWAERN